MKPWAGLPAGSPTRRHRKAAIWERVTLSLGENVVSLVPWVMFSFLSQVTGSAYQIPGVTSVNPATVPSVLESLNRARLFVVNESLLGVVANNPPSVVATIRPPAAVPERVFDQGSWFRSAS